MPEAAPSRKRQIVRTSHKAILNTFGECAHPEGAPKVIAVPDSPATIGITLNMTPVDAIYNVYSCREAEVPGASSGVKGARG